MRVACCRVADLPLAAQLRASPELKGRPVAVASGPGPRAELVAVSPEAARRGVRRLDTLTQARALCAELCVRVTSPALERAAREALLDAALAVAPRAALAPQASGAWAAEACVFADAVGVEALFGSAGACLRSPSARCAPATPACSEKGFAAALLARAERLGFRAAVAIAASQCIARIAARQLREDRVQVIAPGAEAAFLAPLPLDLFDPDDVLAETLTRFGVRCVRDLLALPRRALGTRLGPQALELIATARGETTEPPLSVPETAQLVEATDLEFAVERLEPLCFVLQGLLSRLLARLEARRLACGELALHLDLEGGGRDARRVGLAAPTLDLRVLMRLLAHALEDRPPAAPVLGAALETEGSALHGDQLDLFRPAGPAPAALGRTLAELQALCGLDRIGAPRAADDHRPHLFEMDPFRPPPPGKESAARMDPFRPPPPGKESAARMDPFPPPPPGKESAARAPRILATRALRPPVPAEVRLAARRPVAIRSAVANGPIVRLAGPWRTTGGWWSPESRYAYDHFDVLTSDGTLSRLRFDHVARLWSIDAVYD